MKNFSLWSLLSALFVFGAVSCSSLSKTGVTVTLGDDSDPMAPIVVFGFDEAIQPDSMAGRIDTNRVVSFEPAMSGRCIWINSRTLVFYAAAPLPSGTQFKASFTRQIVAEGFSANHPEPVSFTTPELEISGSAAWYIAGSNSGTRLPVIELQFNYAVDAPTLAQSLEIRSGSSVVPFTVVSPQTSRKHEIRLTLHENPETVQCVLKQGASATTGGNGTMQPQTVSITFPEPGKIMVVKTETSFSGSEGIVAIVLSEPVEPATLAGNVKVEPFCLFRAEASTSGIALRGSFEDGVNYRITLSRGLKSVFGGTTSYDLETSANFGSPAPSVSFAEENAFYLGSKGNHNLGLYIRNTGKISVKIFRVYENNILHYMRQGKRWFWGEDEGTWYENFEFPFDENYGNTIYDETYDVKALPANGALRLLNLPPGLFKGKNAATGLYVVRVEADKKPWVRDVRLISFSDIGLLAMMNGTELLVQTFSIADGKSIEGTEIQLVSRNNQVVLKGQAGDGGLWIVKDFAEKLGTFEPAMVTARLEDDFNCMVLSENRVETSRFDAVGRFLPKGPYDAFVYGERNLYRPGDSVHFVAVVRDRSWKAPSKLPLIVKVNDAAGHDFLSRQKTTGTNGEIDISFMVPAASRTGNWMLTVSAADGNLLLQHRFLVEEFQPDRIAVQLQSKKRRYTLADKAEISLSANSLIGPPAARARYELEYRLTQQPLHPKGFETYNFAFGTDQLPPLQSVLTEGQADANGKATTYFDFPSVKGTGMWSGSVIATVFDENDRPVIREAVFTLVTQPKFVGVENRQYWVSTGQMHPFRLTTVDADGKFTSDVHLEIEVKRVIWETVIIKQNGNARYESQQRVIHETSHQFMVHRNGDIWNFTPMISGQYLVRFRVAGTNLWVEERLWAYGSGSSNATSFGVNREGEITLQSDKETYTPGEKAKILLQTPFDGPVSVVVVQGDGKFGHHTLEAKNRAASFEITIADELKPNCYIAATLIRRPDLSDLPLTVAHGLLNINVVNVSTKLTMAIDAAERSKGRTQQRVVVKAAPGATVTLAAVDEGILQLTNHVTPDPWSWFYGRRAFDAQWYDLYARLFPELSARFSSSGGDAATDMGRRVNPFGNKQAKPAVWWSGLRKADPQGRCTFNVPIPAFSGKLRLMAVAFNGQAMGSAERFMVVADPVVITAGLPAFLSPGDQLLFPVNLMNTTGKVLKATMKVTARGAARLTSGGTSSVVLQPNVQNRSIISLKATDAIGDGAVRIEIQGDGINHTESFEFNVRPAAGPVKRAGSGLVANSETGIIETELKVLPGSARSSLWLTLNPMGEFITLLNDLLSYPYGCLEQTTSAAFPQLYLLDPADRDAAFVGPEATRNVTEAINRIATMQLYNGAFSYWQGDPNESWWASVYATHFLVEARKAGFEVKNSDIERALDWLYQQSARIETESYGFLIKNQQVDRQTRAKRETIYSLYVLSLAGRPNLSAMNYYKDHYQLLTTDSRVVLAASFLLAGDKQSFGALMPGNHSIPEPVRSNGGSFYSPVSSVAWAINALLTVSPNDKAVTDWLHLLLSALRSSDWMSTFDKSQAMCALARIYHQQPAAKVMADITLANGKTIRFDGNDLTISRQETIFPVKIKPHGKGNVYYSWVLEGAGAEAVEPADRVLMVRRALLDRDGHPINRPVRHGELVVVKISLQTILPITVENVAVSDLLPACFEIENPRLAPGRDFQWITEGFEPAEVDVRHDRINIFSSASEQVRNFFYLARVIASGEFATGSTSAEAMYNGQFYSVTAQGRIVSVVR